MYPLLNSNSDDSFMRATHPYVHETRINTLFLYQPDPFLLRFAFYITYLTRHHPYSHLPSTADYIRLCKSCLCTGHARVTPDAVRIYNQSCRVGICPFVTGRWCRGSCGTVVPSGTYICIHSLFWVSDLSISYTEITYKCM